MRAGVPIAMPKKLQRFGGGQACRWQESESHVERRGMQTREWPTSRPSRMHPDGSCGRTSVRGRRDGGRLRTPPAARPGARRWRRCAVVPAVLLAICAAAGCASAPHAEPGVRRVGLTNSPGPLPANQEQTDREVVPTGDVARVMVMHDPFAGTSPVPGSEHAFTVGDSPMVGTGDKSRSTVVPGQSLSTARTARAACVYYAGTGAENGTGIDSSCDPLSGGSAGTRSPVLLIPDWPEQGTDVYVWSHLPSSVRIVTYSYRGQDRTWVAPIDATAVLSVPRPPAFDGSYRQWHSAPFPLLRAYDAHHHLVVAQYAPRIGGDVVPRVP